MRQLVVFALTAAIIIGGTAITWRAPVASATTPNFVPASMPTGAEGQLIAYGKNIIRATHKYAGSYAVAGMSCEACHIDAGTKAHGGSLVGIYGTFPQWNERSKRFIALQDRLAECFLYSMNGRPPAFDSREMIALTAYIAYISRGTVVGRRAPGQDLVRVSAPHAPSVAAGRSVYDSKCSACHGATGAGRGAFPPLWGQKSFNDGAGMHRASTMAAFVRYNMPAGSMPNTLSAQQAVDVTAFVLSHSRPKFDKTRMIAFPPEPAESF